MKFSLVAFLPFSGAFAPSAFVRPAVTTLFSADEKTETSRPDTSEWIQKAFEATEKFGATSPEARLAWEAVEEMDATDNSNAFASGLEDCSVEEDQSDECQEYSQKLDELTALINENKPIFEKVRSAAADMRAIKMKPPTPAAGKDSPELRAAIKEAKEATEEFGISSTQAVLAWETVEEIASADNTPALGGKIDDECLVEMIEACEALEEVGRALNLD